MKKLTLIICLTLVSGFAFSQWVQITPGNSNPLLQLNSVFFTGTNTGYAVGNYERWEDGYSKGIILKTIDGGAKWDTIWRDVPSENSSYYSYLNSVFFTDAYNGFAVGWCMDYNVAGLIKKTIDGGITWITCDFYGGYALNSVFFIDANTGFVWGEDGTISKTINGGVTWDSFFYDEYSSNSFNFPDINRGYFVGQGAFITKTIDGSARWTELSRGINSVYFIDANSGYAVGNEGVIIKTTDGGSNWVPLWRVTYDGEHYIDLFSVFFTDANTGYVVGWDSHKDLRTGYYKEIILKTIDGGVTWENTLLNSIFFKPNSIFFPNANTGYVLGAKGIILKTTNGGGFPTVVDNVLQESSFTVYPNPATNKISIATKSNLQGETTICIFNMNGAILQHEKFQSQNLIEMDVSAMAKGIYLLKIQTKAGVESKKLVVQ